jgi:PD-(D/E)XK nuclease superfamily protein
VIEVAQKPVIRRSLAEGLLSCVQFTREDGEQLAFGQALHSFIAAYTLLCQAKGEETRLIDFSRLAAEAWARTHGLKQSRWQEFQDLCQHFAETRPASLSSLLHVEHTLTLDVGWAILVCTVDRLDRADLGDPDEAPIYIQISDWKTERAELDHDFQARWYSQMVFLTMPSVQDVVFAVHALRDWWKPEPFVFRRGELDLWWDAMLTGLKARLDVPHALPVGGPACPGCAKRYECARSTAVAGSIPENEDQADEQFQEVLRLEEAIDVRKEGLKRFYSGHAERVVNGHEIGYLTPRDPRLVITVAAMDFLKFVRRRRLIGDQVLKVDTEQLGGKQLQQKLVDGGVAKHEFSRPSFKWRKHVPAKDARRQKEKEKESVNS